MKTGILFCAVLAVAVTGWSRDVILLGAQGERDAPPSYAVVAGGSLTLDVLIPVSLDRATIVAGLWQSSGGLALPLKKDIAVDVAPDAHGITAMRLDFPTLERKTRVLVKFTVKDEPRTVLGVAQVQVYPRFDWAPITRKLKQDGRRLLVFGEDDALRIFFKDRGVEFADNGVNPPDRLDRDTIAVGALPAKDWAERKDRFAPEGGGLIVFVAGADGLPGVYTQAAGDGAISKITLTVPAKLAQDPRAEELLFQLIEQHLHTATAANF
jgi:hypothetical protein